MPHFHHQFAESSSVEIDVGEKAETVLVVKTSLALWPMAEDYREASVNHLEADAKAFQLKYKIDKLRLVSTRSI